MKRTQLSIPVLVLVARVALADAPPPVHALVVHVPIVASEPGAPIQLEAMIDAPYAEHLRVHWRAVGEPAWHDAVFERSSTGDWYATLPPALPPGIEYYIAGTDSSGAEVDHFASAAAPQRVHVDPDLYDRLEVQDERRLAGRTEEVALDITAHDFGNRYGLDDHFVRGELVYTHHLNRLLHDVGFGYGSVEGKTPTASMSGADVATRGLRYGFGQATLRFGTSVFVDGRLGMGVADGGFTGLVRGAITFGKPWRSNVSLGAEYLGELGPTAWVRLQWDTAPPLLMGASIVRTDLPGALVSPVGMYLAYDVSYRLADRLTLRGQLSYGGRDGSAHFGGGFGTSVAF